MNLTLRTLLAWLDDTLPPGEVREIGMQVAESPFAKELVERINKVTRQRRLTVPSSSGSDAVDPNLIACYLDSELDSERVVAYEQKCLTSDVHLAEVVSVHQILSLIGQKAKVPIEARHRMYALIKGRESIAPKSRRRARAPEPEPISEPIQPWVTPEPPRRPWYERYGPLAAVAALMAVLCWSAWMSLKPPPTSVAESVTAAAPPVPPPAAAAKSAPATEPAPKLEAEPAPTEPATTEPTPTEPVAAPKPNLPAGSIGQVESTTGVMLRYNADPLSPQGRQWIRIDPKTALKSQDRLLSLPPFRTTLELGGAKVDLVGECEVSPLAPTPMQAVRLNLVQGRLVMHGPDPAAPVSVVFAGRTLTFTPPAGVLIGLERLSGRDAVARTASAPALRIYVPEGEVGVKVDASEETLSGPAAVTFQATGQWNDRSSDPAPAWVTKPKPNSFDASLGDEFLKSLRPDRPVMAGLVEALGDESKDVRRLAIASLRAVGDVSYVLPLLNQKEEPVIRRAAIDALRDFLTLGPESTRVLHAELINNFGADQTEKVEKLLAGYTPKEAKDESTFTSLVQLLATTDETLVGLRELALDNLQALTGRDNLGYNPDKPEGKGLKAWKDLLRDKELHPAATPKAKKKEAAKD